MTGWVEVGDGVLVRRHQALDLNCGLILGDDACLVVDTRSHLVEAADLIEAVRAVTPHPWTVVNTHAHYDHCFGNAAFRPAPIWGSRGCAADLRATGEQQRSAVVAGLRAAGRPEEADLVQAAPVDPPDHLVDDVAVLDVGGREVVLRFLGRGHTDHDLVVEVEDGDGTVVFAGDLVEEGAPPAFDDAFPADWPATLGRVHALARGPVVPGHGAVVDAAYVGAQREELLAVLTALRAGRPQDGPYDAETMATAAARPL
ncbi:MBL fold metallo-hydrolase [Blastococcus jejuensis]|uniref:MBL fold metallo-hydrolase n=1 Tax=Blastococcus jejuensis TaxID=351224 RepID=A0ABP6P2X9_9ACTN